MKVITEEILKRKISDYDLANCNLSEPLIISKLISECKEIDTLTVRELRPMCDLNVGESVLVKFNGGSAFYAAYVKTSQFLMIDEDQFGIDLFQGWIPMPILEPE